MGRERVERSRVLRAARDSPRDPWSLGREVRGRLRRPSQKQRAERSVEKVEVCRDDVGEVRVEFELGKDRRLIVSGALTAEMIVELAVRFETVGAQ